MTLQNRLWLAGIKIPDETPKTKLELIDTGLQLCELDNEDVIRILDKNTTIRGTEQILRDNRISEKFKYLDYKKNPSNYIGTDLAYEYEMEL